MTELKLRGYVTPEDFEGSDGERIQKAMDMAKELDIARVVLSGTYKAEAPIVIPGGMHVVFDNAVVYGELRNPVVKNMTFPTDRIYMEGRNGKVVGDVKFCHTNHLVMENMAIDGDVELLLARNTRMEQVEIAGRLTIGRASESAIVQHVQCDSLLLNGEDKGYDIIGWEPIIKNILVRRSKITKGALLQAGDDCILLNIQLDEICSEGTAVTVGTEGKQHPADFYQHLSFIDLDAPEKVVFHNEHTCVHVR